jgi:hypothetical protein
LDQAQGGKQPLPRGPRICARAFAHGDGLFPLFFEIRRVAGCVGCASPMSNGPKSKVGRAHVSVVRIDRRPIPVPPAGFRYHWNQVALAARFWRRKWLKVREVQIRPMKKGRKSAKVRFGPLCERGRGAKCGVRNAESAESENGTPTLSARTCLNIAGKFKAQIGRKTA